ncbi:hypothetical protein M0R45_021673 [Rubus argutus]|uniref:MHC class I antigen n=1 Tax=Rubus argutus TaxID=59490 RepID=A0AAW1XDN6_RUBAR
MMNWSCGCYGGLGGENFRAGLDGCSSGVQVRQKWMGAVVSSSCTGRAREETGDRWGQQQRRRCLAAAVARRESRDDEIRQEREAGWRIEEDDWV